MPETVTPGTVTPRMVTRPSASHEFLLPEAEPKGSFRDRWRRQPLRVRLWWWVGLGLGLTYSLMAVLGAWNCLQAILFALFVLWALPTAAWTLYRLWRKLTYRISVRLFLSYLLIGVLPIMIVAGMLGFAAYILIGQYASAEFGDLVRQVSGELVRLAAAAVEAPSWEATSAALERGVKLPGDLAAVTPHIGWLASSGDDVQRGRAGTGGGPPSLSDPRWLEQGQASGLFVTEIGPVMAAIAARGERRVVVYLPMQPAVSQALSRDHWFEARFIPTPVEVDDTEGGFSVDGSGSSVSTGVASKEGGETRVDVDDQEEGTLFETALSGDGLWRKRWVLFFRLSPELRDWADGQVLPRRSLMTLMITSPQEAVADLFRSPFRTGRAFWGVFLAVGIFSMTIYVAVVGLAVLQIVLIARATSRLTRGARAIQAGRLDHRVPVRRRDQLGDLALTFNQMTESVVRMLDEVAEKERLKGELELAREIQQSLLPGHRLRHGGLAVHAVFRSATEVGGDYFDLFPLEAGRMIVTVGDVAGHGLSTGLLMAMVKSAVATLVQEGHRGAEILERLNRLMLQQPRQHRMVTLLVAEIDTVRGVAEITNAAHPPLFLTGEAVHEVLLPALPVGFTWRRPPPSRRLELVAGSRLVFYSDGLVEALDASEEPFGYARLRDFLAEHVAATSEELLARLLAELERHVGGRPLDDDLTVLIIDCEADPPAATAGPAPTTEPAAHG